MAAPRSSSFRLAVMLRLAATVSALLTGILSLKLYGAFFENQKGAFGMVMVALQILAYIPLLNFGFRTTINQKLLSTTDPAENQALLRLSQVFYTYLSVIVLFASVLAMLVYSNLPIAREDDQSLLFFVTAGIMGGFTFYALNQSNLLIGLHAQEVGFLVISLQAWATLIALAQALMNGWGVWAFIFSNFVGVAATLPLSIYALRRLKSGVKFLDWKIPQDFWIRLRTLKTAAFDCFWTDSSLMFMFTADLVLVGILFPSEAAVYGVLVNLFTRIRAFLQIFGEAAWPIIAAKGGQNETISNPLLRLNAWIYGAVLGALLPTLTALTALLTTVQWIPDQTLVLLFIIRNLISGIWSAAGYFMMGMGHFKTLRKYFQREVIADLILGSVLGYFYGPRGILTGFLLGTAFGTLFPLMREYSKASGRKVWDVLLQVWWRAGVAFLVGWACATTLLPLIWHRWLVFGVLAVAASSGLLPALFWALLQRLRMEKSLLKGLTLRQIVRQC